MRGCGPNADYYLRSSCWGCWVSNENCRGIKAHVPSNNQQWDSTLTKPLETPAYVSPGCAVRHLPSSQPPVLTPAHQPLIPVISHPHSTHSLPLLTSSLTYFSLVLKNGMKLTSHFLSKRNTPLTPGVENGNRMAWVLSPCQIRAQGWGTKLDPRLYLRAGPRIIPTGAGTK